MAKRSPSTSERKKTGNRGEQAAADYLLTQGYSVVETNARPIGGMRRGEIDIVAYDGPCLCIVEVKSCTSLRADPLENVTPAKRRQLVKLAQAYIELRRVPETVEIRFDVVTVVLPRNEGPMKIELIRNAFWPE